jgi:hypothetical protein
LSATSVAVDPESEKKTRVSGSGVIADEAFRELDALHAHESEERRVRDLIELLPDRRIDLRHAVAVHVRPERATPSR